MFKKNTKHTQSNIFGFSNLVSLKMAKELQESEELKTIKFWFFKSIQIYVVHDSHNIY